MKLCDVIKLLMPGQKVELNFYSRSSLNRIAKYETEFESDIYLKYGNEKRKNGQTSALSEHFINDIKVADMINVFVEEFYKLRVISISTDDISGNSKLIINIDI